MSGGCSGSSPPTTTSGSSRRGRQRAGFHSSFYYLSSNYPLASVKPESRQDTGPRGGRSACTETLGRTTRRRRWTMPSTRFSGELGFRPTGLREHYLKFDFARSWPIMEAAGFDYDTTVGNNDRLGFKLGLATPFHPPDGEWTPMRLLELPLVLMDTTLWGYLKRSEEEGFGDSMRMIEDGRGRRGPLHAALAPGGGQDEGRAGSTGACWTSMARRGMLRGQRRGGSPVVARARGPAA